MSVMTLKLFRDIVVLVYNLFHTYAVDTIKVSLIFFLFFFFFFAVVVFDANIIRHLNPEVQKTESLQPPEGEALEKNKTICRHLRTYQEKTFARLRFYRGRIGCQMITMRRVCVGVTRILSYQVTDPRKWKGFPVWNGDSLVTKNEMKSIER